MAVKLHPLLNGGSAAQLECILIRERELPLKDEQWALRHSIWRCSRTFGTAMLYCAEQKRTRWHCHVVGANGHHSPHVSLTETMEGSQSTGGSSSRHRCHRPCVALTLIKKCRPGETYSRSVGLRWQWGRLGGVAPEWNEEATNINAVAVAAKRLTQRRHLGAVEFRINQLPVTRHRRREQTAEYQKGPQVSRSDRDLATLLPLFFPSQRIYDKRTASPWRVHRRHID